MIPWLRLIGVGCRALAESKVDLLATTSIRLRAWPTDMDMNLHVNNGRYLMLADLGRTHWVVRTGMLKIAREQKALPIVGDAIAKFRRDIKAFQAFEIRTRLVGWDRKWGFIEHRFVREDRVIGVVAVRGIFKGPEGPIDSEVFLAKLSPGTTSPALPGWARDFHRSSELLSETIRDEERSRGLRPANE